MRFIDAELVAERSRMSLRARVARLRAKGWVIGQCAVAAGIAWWLAADVFNHRLPFFAPIAAVVSLGMSYGQRQRRVAEVTIGVALGSFIFGMTSLGIVYAGWDPNWFRAFLGVMLLLAVLVNLYVKKLSDIDLTVLRELLEQSYRTVKDHLDTRD